MSNQIKNVLLISGPAGGGKSTFVECLSDGSLSESITRNLPSGVNKWPCLEANDALKNGTSVLEMLSGNLDHHGVILHYDIAFIHTRGLDDYSSDPIMEFVESAESLYIVFVKPDADRLIQQFRERRDAHLGRKSGVSRFVTRYIRNPIRHLKNRCTGAKTYKNDALYRSDGWLKECYSQWEEYVLYHLNGPDKKCMCCVSPVEKGADYRFLLLDE